MCRNMIVRAGWGLFLSALIAAAFFAVRADVDLGKSFKPDDRVQTLTIRIDIAKAGGDLVEPVALDLGLGFPLWLHPVGRGNAGFPPFGAVPQEGTATIKVAAGSHATFTFRTTGKPGLDELRTTPQLLKGVRVSDIARIGFSSPGKGTWILDGYELQINGQVFASAKHLGAKVDEARKQAESRLTANHNEAAKLQPELGVLKDLAKTKLATPAELTKLKTLEKKTDRLADEAYRLQKQLDGAYPWFVQSDFHSPWRSTAAPKSARVTLITSTIPKSGTQNNVYFQTGGRRFLLGSAQVPLTATAGAQVFPLDLRLTPLATADIRGFAVGMLAGDQHYAQAPDRWAPERILVEIDGRTVYDSDENPIDRKSLAAIRLIPPAHLDETGKLVTNDAHSEREFYLWEAGRAQGLDLEKGGAKPLPPPDNPASPKPEPVSPTDPPPAGDSGGGAGFPPLPGEAPGGGDGGFGGGGLGPGGLGGGGLGPGGLGGGGLGLGGGPYGPLWDLLWHLLFNGNNGGSGNGNGGGGGGGGGGSGGGGGGGPNNTGTPPTVGDVAFTSGWKTNDAFGIEWKITGDKSKITETIVQLWDCHPEAPFPYGPNLLASKSVAGSGPVTLTVNQPVATTVHYFVPQVTIKLKDNTTNSEYGPARPVFPPYTIPLLDKTTLYNKFDYWDSGNVKHTLPLTNAPGPQSGRGVWKVGKTGTDTDLRIDDSAQPDLDHNGVVLHDVADKRIRLAFFRFINSKTRITMYYGAAKRGAGDLGNGPFPISPRAISGSYAVFPPTPFQGVLFLQRNIVPIPNAPEPMKLYDTVVDFPGINNQLWLLLLTVDVEGGVAENPDFPPTLFGVRMIPEK